MSARKSLDAGIALFLFGVGVAVYAGAMNSDFVNFDDQLYGTKNPMVAAGITPTSVAYAWTTFDVGNWIPLTWMSLELDATLFGTAPGPFHRTNILLHGLNVVLLFVALKRMTGAIGRSAIVALLFAVHPLHVESVAWISERKDVLSTAFLLIALIAYERYAACPTWGRWMLVALAMTLGLLSKSMLVTLPILLLLLDWWPLNRFAGNGKDLRPQGGPGSCIQEATEIPISRVVPAPSQGQNAHDDHVRYPQRTPKALLIEKLPLFVLAFLDGVITIIAQKHTDAVRSLDLIPIHFRIGNALQSYGWYLWKTIVPTHLCALYVHPGRDLEWKWVMLAIAVLAIVTLFVFWNSANRGPRQFGWVWFLVAFLPVIGLLQVGGIAHADRYAYVPHIGLFVFIVWEAHAWLMNRRIDPKWGIAFGFGIAIFWSIRTIEQVAVWHDSVSLWAHVLLEDPLSDHGRQNLAGALFERGRIDEAEQHFLKSIEISKATDPNPIYNLGEIQGHRGNRDSAIEYYRWALRIDPDYKPSKRRLSEIARQNPKEEKPSPPSKISRPNRERLQLGLAAMRRGDMAGALHQFQAAIEIDPNDADAHNNAAFALSQLKRPREAEAAQRKAVLLAPANADFQVNLAAFVESTNPAEAAELYRNALRLRPSDVEAQRRLELLKTKLGQP